MTAIDFQSVLAGPMEAFLSYKRALGNRFDSEEKMLRLLDRYLIEQQVTTLTEITPALLEAFLASRPRHRPQSYNQLLGGLRRLFDWLVTQGTLPQSPLQAPPRRVTSQPRPFIFDRLQARQLLDVAARLPSRPTTPDRGPTYRMIFALAYGLGLRVGEVSRLCWQDVDSERDLLVIRQTKFRKTRLVPFGPRMAACLQDYRQQQQTRWGPRLPTQPVFSLARDRSRPIPPNTLSETFHRLLPELALTIPAGVAPPHLHCLRHSFAVGTLLRWYRAGVDPAQRLLSLSTFLGHVSPSSTAVYLTITAELLQTANQRFERFVAPVLQEIEL